MNRYDTCDCDVIHQHTVDEVRKKLQPKEEYLDLAALYKMFGDGTRVQILHALEQSEMCVCDIAQVLGMTVSAISHQLRVLKQAKLVKCRLSFVCKTARPEFSRRTVALVQKKDTVYIGNAVLFLDFPYHALYPCIYSRISLG